MILDYLQPGDPIDRDAMVTLWTELERKMGVVLSGKSFFAHSRIASDLLATHAVGKLFAFYNVSTPDDRVFFVQNPVAAYDHQAFVDAVAAATVSSYDDTNRIAWISSLPVDLDESLEAHTVDHNGTPYYVGVGDYPTEYVRPQKHHAYAVAEIVCENRESLLIEDRWDKYSFFRIHNLDRRRTLEVRFGRHHTRTLAPLECFTVRRTAVDGVYTEGTYFWPVEVGDPSFYNGGSVAGFYPERSMPANNVVNPAILFVWVKALESADIRSSFGWWIDPTQYFNQWPLYDDKFADPTSDKSLLGDCLWHKGDLRVAVMAPDGTTELKSAAWNGFSRLPAGPLQRTINGDGSVTVASTESDPCDIISVTSNLAATAANFARAVAPLPLTIPSDALTVSLPPGYVTSVSQLAVTWYPVGPGIPKTQFDASEPRTEFFSYETAAPTPGAAKTFGPMTSIGEVRSWVGQVWGDMAAGRMAPDGFRWSCARNLDWSRPGFSVPSGVTLTTGAVQQWYHVHMGIGWPDSSYPATLSLPCRFERRVDLLVRLGSDWLHPDFVGVGLSVNGADVTFRKPPLPGTTTEVSLQQVAPYHDPDAGGATDHTVVPFWYIPMPGDMVPAILSNTDEEWYQVYRSSFLAGYDAGLDAEVFGAARMLRVPMVCEHYNHMAWMVNAITLCRPLTIADVEFSHAGVTFTVPANEVGLVDSNATTTTIRPKNQYASFAAGSVEESQWRALGVPIKTEDDLPDAWKVANALWRTTDTHTLWRIEILKQYGAGEVHVEGSFSSWQSWYTCPYFWQYSRLTRLNDYRDTLEVTSTSPFVFVDQPFRWVAVEDVASLAAAKGLGFIHAPTVRPLRVVAMNSDAPTLLGYSTTVAAGFETSERYLEATEAAVRAWAEYYLGLVENKTFTINIDFSDIRTSIRLAEAESLDDADLVAAPGYAGTMANDTRGDLGIVLSEVAQNRTRRVYQFLGQETELGQLYKLYFVEGVPIEVRSIDALELRTMAFDPTFLAPVADRSVALLTPSHTVTREVDYATESEAKFWQSFFWGNWARQPIFHQANPTAARMDAIEDGMIACRPGERAFLVTVIPELVAAL